MCVRFRAKTLLSAILLAVSPVMALASTRVVNVFGGQMVDVASDSGTVSHFLISSGHISDAETDLVLSEKRPEYAEWDFKVLPPPQSKDFVLIQGGRRTYLVTPQGFFTLPRNIDDYDRISIGGGTKETYDYRAGGMLLPAKRGRLVIVDHGREKDEPSLIFLESEQIQGKGVYYDHSVLQLRPAQVDSGIVFAHPGFGNDPFSVGSKSLRFSYRYDLSSRAWIEKGNPLLDSGEIDADLAGKSRILRMHRLDRDELWLDRSVRLVDVKGDLSLVGLQTRDFAVWKGQQAFYVVTSKGVVAELPAKTRIAFMSSMTENWQCSVVRDGRGEPILVARPAEGNPRKHVIVIRKDGRHMILPWETPRIDAEGEVSLKGGLLTVLGDGLRMSKRWEKPAQSRCDSEMTEAGFKVYLPTLPPI